MNQETCLVKVELKLSTNLTLKPDIEEFKQEPMDEMKLILSSETNSLSEQIHRSSETGNEIVHKPDPDIDIEEFKQEPMNFSEMILSLSSETTPL